MANLFILRISFLNKQTRLPKVADPASMAQYPELEDVGIDLTPTPTDEEAASLLMLFMR